MAFFNFGYAVSASKAAASASASRDTSPPFSSADILNMNIGDTTGSQLAYLTVMGGKFDFLWGCHLWGSSKYKVTK